MKNTKRKNSKLKLQEAGITLVALVVTIIVLLILAGVTIIIALSNNGVIGRAQYASNTWANATKDETTVMDNLQQQIVELSSFDGSGDTVNPLRANITPAPTGATYTEGQEVTFGGEQFFVLSDDGIKLKLIAKYCLNQDGTAQLNAVQGETGTGRDFSSDYYNWHNEGNNDFIDLQTEENIRLVQQYDSVPQNAILTAISYGEAKGVSGRLMTYEEIENIENLSRTMKDIIYGKWEGTDSPVSGYLRYWTGCFDINTPGPVYIDGEAEGTGGPDWGLIGESSFFPGYSGVRPILVI